MKKFNNIRLAGVPLSLTLISILAGSVINRVMVVELGLPVTLAGLFLAVPLFVAPVRVWLGHQSDANPVRGLRREPYIVLGAILSGLGAAVSVALVLRTTELFSLGAFAILVTLIVYGIGKNLATNTFTALLADLFASGPSRQRAATLYEVMKMVGMIIGAGVVGMSLRPYSPGRLTAVVSVIGLLAVILSLLAAIKQEPRGDRAQAAIDEAKSVNFRDVVKNIVLKDPQVRLFFGVVMITLLGTQMQDVILEPYGAKVFGMDVSDTTQLTMFWGLGTLLAMLLSGLVLIKKFGHLRVFRTGLTLVIVTFPLIILAGSMKNEGMLRLMVAVLGLGTGVSAASLLIQMIEFTTAARAGLLVGVWGVAHQLGRAFASLLGGAVVDGMLTVTNENALISYGAAFVIESLLLVWAMVLIGRIDVAQSQIWQDETGGMKTAVAPAD
ncbi:MAG: BCD family MFS transporter [Chloroflexi bacterium]|nr:BCD family MFS transporter [Chloroflexota bacterium]